LSIILPIAFDAGLSLPWLSGIADNPALGSLGIFKKDTRSLVGTGINMMKLIANALNKGVAEHGIFYAKITG